MKTLVVYYSQTGHNEQMAKQLNSQMPGDIDQIIDMRKREGMFRRASAAMLKFRTKIKFSKDPAAYDQVVVVSPLWAGSLPPATRTYLAQNRGKFKLLSFLSVCGLGEENAKALADFTGAAKKRPLEMLLLKEQEVESDSAKERQAEFVSQLPH